MKFELINGALNILMKDDLISDVEILRYEDDDFAIGFHTDLPTRDDDNGETHEQWFDRADPDYDNIDYGGLSSKTLEALAKLGVDVQINDCEGLENEGIVNVIFSQK
jgi:hypothetical protein